MPYFPLLNIASSTAQTGYIIGLFIAVAIFIYLLYALIKPEKF
jgi:K+-transporting ATPase, KdpF subunit